ncbi:MAG: YaiI/YqxD family protein [Clostridia bacterium]
MNILVDADACPVKDIVLRVAREKKIPVVMFADTSHVIHDGYSETVTVDKAKDAVDIALANRAVRGDVVVTQDYGVAAMAIAKGAKALNQNGLVFTDENIDGLLFERHLSLRMRKAGLRTAGPGKRKTGDNACFEVALRKLTAQNPE